MATHWKKHLADAHQHTRKLENKVHELEEQLKDAIEQRDELAVRADVAESKGMSVAYELAEERASRTPDGRAASDIELYTLASMMAMQVIQETPARRAMLDAAQRELVRRGVMVVDDVAQRSVGRAA